MQLYKKTSRATQYFIITPFLLALAACSPQPKKQAIDCKVDAHQCLQLRTENSQIEINTRAVIVEQNYKMTLTSKLAIDSIKLEGINMSMGIIPVIAELVAESDGNFIYQAEMFLGMCSEPKMQWLVTITYANGKTESTVFDSYWQAPN